MSGSTHNAKQQRSISRRWAFRLFAVLVGLSPFILFEASLWIIGWQPTIPVSDPFVDFETVRPLFVADDDGATMKTALNRLEYFRPESFAAEKEPNEFRVVCFGGSTVQGRPYAVETSFTTWLELSLRAADASRKWEVINCGGVSYASYRLAPIVEEMLRYEPDLIILYTGHNEFLEDRSYATAKQAPKFVSHSFSELSRLKGLQFLHEMVAAKSSPDDLQSGDASDKEMLASEVEALLDYQGGLEHYHRDAEWRQAVIEHFEFNLRRIIEMANRNNTLIMLVDPSAKLRDCPPFKSEHTTGLSVDDLAKVQRLVEEASELPASNASRAIKLMEEAVSMDPDHAGIQFRLGTYYAESADYANAKQHLRIALEEDVCPLRIIEPLNQVIRKVSEDTNTPVIDVREKFDELSEGAIPGRNLFFDHVHPSFYGHQMIAEEIMNELVELKIVKTDGAYVKTRDELYDQHWQSLEPLYFERGKQRLEGLEMWAKGRSNKIRRDQR